MDRKIGDVISCRCCGTELRSKRAEQNYCSPACRKAAWNGTKKRRLGTSRTGIPGSVQNGVFSATKSVALVAVSLAALLLSKLSDEVVDGRLLLVDGRLLLSEQFSPRLGALCVSPEPYDPTTVLALRW